MADKTFYNKSKMSISEQFQKAHNQKIIENLANSHARLSETMGGMNPNEQSYEHFNYASFLIKTAEGLIKEGIPNTNCKLCTELKP